MGSPARSLGMGTPPSPPTTCVSPQRGLCGATLVMRTDPTSVPPSKLRACFSHFPVGKLRPRAPQEWGLSAKTTPLPNAGSTGRGR